MTSYDLDELNAQREAATERARPFSNGSQDADWMASNCDHCAKRWHEATNDWRCEIDAHLTLAAFDDGSVPVAIAERMGYREPADGEYPAYCWMCPEVEWTEAWKAEVRARKATA
jgi:hypothetical protein